MEERKNEMTTEVKTERNKKRGFDLKGLGLRALWAGIGAAGTIGLAMLASKFGGDEGTDDE